MPKLNTCVFSLILFICSSVTVCGQQNKNNKLFTILPSSSTGVNFRNDITEDADMYYYLYEYLYNGAGVSIGDFNNDGLPDLYFSSSLGSNKLFLNEGNFHFKDITKSAGVDGGAGLKTGVNVIDFNNDGYPDIFICKSGMKDPKLRKKILYINNHDLTFTNRATEYGLDDDSYTTQAYFFDYDKDGDMDVLFVNHPRNFDNAVDIVFTQKNGKLELAEDTAHQYVSDRLFENRNGHFIDVTKRAGMLSHAFGLSAVIFDFNNDGWPDIFVANDFNQPDFLYINNKNGTFTNHLKDYFRHTSFFSMGTDMNDINNDGLEDLMVLDMAIEDPIRQKQLFTLNVNFDKQKLMERYNLFLQYTRNTLQLNNGNNTFSDIAYHAGVSQTDWSWCPLIADFDNDGWKDMYFTNGLKRDITDWDYKEFVLDSIKNLFRKGLTVKLSDWFKQIPVTRIKNYFFHNTGTLRFENTSDEWCDQVPSFSNGAAYVDLDNDGDLDLVVNNVDDEAFIYRNNNNELNPASHYINFRFLKDRQSPAEVYGASVKLLDANGNIQVQHYDPQRGYMSTMEHQLHFGTGNLSVIPTVEIVFPSQKKLTLSNVKTNQLIKVYESDALAQPIVVAVNKPLLKDLTAQHKFKYTHVENDFIDFKREPLIPYQCSRKGPYYAQADVNGDKKEDIFIGGAAGIPGKLMIQSANGIFTESRQDCFEKDKAKEDNGVLFFDADGDGDADLYVVSGGAQFPAGDHLYQDRLYFNDGKGHFTKAMNALPSETNNGSCVIPLDFNGDGAIDLFVGGGVLPGKFPLHDKCMLLQNNKGVFTDVTNQIVPEINELGIVNAATWADMDGDKVNELIVTGEWMGPTIFKMVNGKFRKMSNTVHFNISGKDTATSMDALKGWWNCIKAVDIDNDGDIDLIVGNRGTNSKVNADMNHPCKIYAKDFDGNGSYDAVLGYYIGNKCYPMFSRDQLIDQMPMFRKKYYRYKMYAGRTMDELFTPEQQVGMQIFSAGCFESGVLVNDGNGSYHFQPLPEMAQLSTINDFVVDDFNGDGINDMLVCGNSNDADAGTGNYDATAALLLTGDGKGGFKAMMPLASGLNFRGEVRKIVYLKESGTLFFLKNSDAAEVFSLK